MERRVDIDKIAKGLGAHRLGVQEAKGGHFGAMQLVADVKARFKTPKGGGRFGPSRAIGQENRGGRECPR